MNVLWLGVLEGDKGEIDTSTCVKISNRSRQHQNKNWAISKGEQGEKVTKRSTRAAQPAPIPRENKHFQLNKEA